MSRNDFQKLIDRMRKGDRRALARLLSLVEELGEASFRILEAVWPHTGRAYSIGVTGPSGAGKSTLIDQLIGTLRARGQKVAVIAVDPTSPFSGGAVLGDRVRMQRHATDPEVFIRSVGSRGRSGGVSLSTRALMQLLDAFGAGILLVETVGAGQSEVNVADLVDATLVVLQPGGGDSIQTLKAGILEIADIFVVNKMDLDGAAALAAEIESMLPAPPCGGDRRASVVRTDARSGEGIHELLAALDRRRAARKKAGPAPEERLRKRARELAEIVEARLAAEILPKLLAGKELAGELEGEREPNLYAVAARLIGKLPLPTTVFFLTLYCTTLA